nr:MAG TPA: hypothetical protein [Caudoviricetes sp.]
MKYICLGIIKPLEELLNLCESGNKIRGIHGRSENG